MYDFIPYQPVTINEDERSSRAESFYQFHNRRRSIRDFSPRPVPREILEHLIRTAGTAPSGANKQPWMFVVVTDRQLKREIRIAAEKEEQENYSHRMPEEWLRDLEPLGVDWSKPFLEVAPALIAVFQKNYDLDDGMPRKNYYVRESVGIACGLLLTAIHNAGLVGLTHTPSPMDFLSKILARPENERPYLLIPVGYPAENATVPNIRRKPLSEISEWR